MTPFTIAKLALMLIDQTSNEEFEPSKYKDTVRERVMETIQKKVEGQDITTGANIEPGNDKIIDLMEALKASLAKSKTGAETESASGEKPKKQKVS